MAEDKQKTPTWIKLDNAATIYPATMSRKYAAMFRMTATLTEDVDRDILQEALDNILGRFPSFRYSLKKGLFWCYLRRIEGTPKVQEDVRNPMVRINFNDNSHFMFRVRYFGRRIAVEFFHALTDGTGGLIFLMTLTGEYIRLKYGREISYNEVVFDPKSQACEEEYRDAFQKYARKVGGLDNEPLAYQPRGTAESSHILNIITGIVPVDILKAKSRENGCTLTQFIVAMLIMTIQELQEADKSRRARKRPVKICVPMNLRKMYPSRTMRNFSTYLIIGIETKYGHYSMDEILNEVKHDMPLRASEKVINSRITGNVNLERSFLIKLIPMFIKKYIISSIESLKGAKYFSTTFTNVGLVNLPPEMAPYIDELGFLLGRQRANVNSCGCISCNGKVFFTFTRKIKEPEIERLFFRNLVEAGIPVEIESNNN